MGLGIITTLKAAGVKTVVASDLSAFRRELAQRLGADIAVDPQSESPYASIGSRYLTGVSQLADLGVSTVERLRRRGLPWRQILSTAERVGASPRGPVIFECVGIPGMLDSTIAAAPIRPRIVVVGVCMTPDRFRPALAVNKEVDVRFVVGYTPVEFSDALRLLASGRVDPSPMVTGTISLEQVGDTFEELAKVDSQAKGLIDPTR